MVNTLPDLAVGAGCTPGELSLEVLLTPLKAPRQEGRGWSKSRGGQEDTWNTFLVKTDSEEWVC